MFIDFSNVFVGLLIIVAGMVAVFSVTSLYRVVGTIATFMLLITTTAMPVLFIFIITGALGVHCFSDNFKNMGRYNYILLMFCVLLLSAPVMVEAGNGNGNDNNNGGGLPSVSDRVKLVEEVVMISSQPSAELLGTDYIVGDIGKLQAYLKVGEFPLENAICQVSVLYPNMTYFIEDALMFDVDVPFFEGLYYYDFVVPNATGVFPVNAYCFYNATRSNDFTVLGETDGYGGNIQVSSDSYLFEDFESVGNWTTSGDPEHAFLVSALQQSQGSNSFYNNYPDSPEGNAYYLYNNYSTPQDFSAWTNGSVDYYNNIASREVGVQVYLEDFNNDIWVSPYYEANDNNIWATVSIDFTAVTGIDMADIKVFGFNISNPHAHEHDPYERLFIDNFLITESQVNISLGSVELGDVDEFDGNILDIMNVATICTVTPCGFNFTYDMPIGWHDEFLNQHRALFHGSQSESDTVDWFLYSPSTGNEFAWFTMTNTGTYDEQFLLNDSFQNDSSIVIGFRSLSGGVDNTISIDLARIDRVYNGDYVGDLRGNNELVVSQGLTTLVETEDEDIELISGEQIAELLILLAMVGLFMAGQYFLVGIIGIFYGFNYYDGLATMVITAFSSMMIVISMFRKNNEQ